MKTFSRSERRRRARTKGFTLAETAIAIGIVSTVVLALMGTMPAALNRLHQSSVRSADARALESVVGVFQMRDWSEVTGQEGVLRSEHFYFDRSGVEVSESDFWVTFVAAITVELPPVLPGEPAPNPNLRQLTLELSDRVQGSDPFADPKAVRTYTTLLTRIDR